MSALDPKKLSEGTPIVAADLAAGDLFPVVDVSAGTAGLKTITKAELATAVGVSDPELSALAGLTSAADKGIQFTGSGTAATYDLTAAGKALLDDADAAAQRTTLGLGTAAVAASGDFQAANANLTALAGQTGAADRVSYWTAAATLALATLTAFGRSLIAAADAAGVRTLLGLGTAATTDASAYQASDAELTALAGLTSAADKGIQFTGSGTAATYDLTAAGKALLDDADAAAQRTTLGLGTAAVAASGDFQAANANLTALAGQTGAADRVSYWTAAATLALATLTAFGRSLIAAADAAGVRTLLGLGTAATTDASAYQASDAELTALAGLTSAADKGIQFTGSGTAATYDLTAAGKALLDDADAAAQLVTLGAVGAASPVLTGTVVVRQTGGVAGTDEIQLSHDGANGKIESKDGSIFLKGASFFAYRSDDVLLASVDSSGGLFAYRFWITGFDVWLERVSSGRARIGGGIDGHGILDASSFESKVATGTAPLTVASTTVVTNLNADKLDGLDAADLIAKSLVTTKGDIIGASASATVARLGVGTNGQVLTADSAETLGIKWATASAGGSVDYSTCALLAPAADGGNDTTGTVGDFTKPYATAQAAWADGAKSMELMPNSASYGAIATAGASLQLTIISRGYNGAYNQLGAITTAGGACALQVLTGLRSLRIAGVSTAGTVTGATAGQLTLDNVWVYGSDVNASGTSGTTGEAGGAANTVTIRRSLIDGNVEAVGGNGGQGNGTGSVGLDAGGAAAIDLEETYVAGAVSLSGGSGGEGAGGDAETQGGDGGSSSGGGSLTARRSTVVSTITANGGGGGSGGASGGAGSGNSSSGNTAGSVSGSYCLLNAIVALGGGGSTAGGGGTIDLEFSRADSITTLDGDSVASGSATLNHSKVTNGVDSNSKSGYFAVVNGTTYDTYS